MPERRCSVLYHEKKPRPNERASWMDPKRLGNSGRYFSVLNWASEKGLSLEVWGREWVLSTPRSTRRNSTGLDFMEGPRSACNVSRPSPIPCFSHVSEMSFFAREAASRMAIIHPTTYRLKTVS